MGPLMVHNSIPDTKFPVASSPTIRLDSSRGVKPQLERGVEAIMTVSKKYDNAKLGVSFREAPASSAPEPGPYSQDSAPASNGVALEVQGADSDIVCLEFGGSLSRQLGLSLALHPLVQGVTAALGYSGGARVRRCLAL